MLIILPPSETKHPPPLDGSPLDLERLSFPSLTPARERLLDALVTTSQRPDALRRLVLRPSFAGELDRIRHLRDLPTRPAVETYAGPLYDGIDPRTWSTDVTRRAERQVIIVSALWGALRPADQIPSYRLRLWAQLDGVDRLEPMWRSLLPPVLTDAAARRGPILDLRSPVYQAIGRPTGLDEETVTLRIRPAPEGPAHVGAVIAKRMRGEAARALLSSSAEPGDPLDLADLLAARWSIEVEPPAGRNRSYIVTLEADA